MRRIYISFLGIGNYSPARYHIDGRVADESMFVQRAELQLAGRGYFDQIFIVMTKSSKKKHFISLKEELKGIGIDEMNEIIITEELEPKDQWEWFEEILKHINYGDELTVDLTHGFRIVPIVFSTALNFLQKVKKIHIKSVYYGAYEKDKNLSPIVDVKEFYIIHEWADAVLRLAKDADPGKLGKVAQESDGAVLSEFDDPALVKAFDDLTMALKNIDIHNVAQKASVALDLVAKKEKSASVTGQILLDLVKKKFTALISEKTFTGQYDYDYFNLQLEIINLLIEHKLFMQAYTVMREMLGSFGLIRMQEMKSGAKIGNKNGRRQRRKADIFIRMLQNDEETWNFKEHEQKSLKKLEPLYRDMKKDGIIQQLKDQTNQLVDYRNGFDHAWTSKATMLDDIEKQAKQFYDNLKNIVELLNNKGYFL